MKQDHSAAVEVAGTHYQTPIQPIDYIQANNLLFAEGNIIKYITRHKNKHGYEDVLKAIHYCLFIMKRDYNLNQDTINEVLNILIKAHGE